MITFRSGCYFYVPDQTFREPHVAPYWTDLFPLGGGNGGCFNHQTYTDSVSLTMASDTVKNFTTFQNFQAKWVLVSTWLRVPFYRNNRPVSMSFIFISNGNYSKAHEIELYALCFEFNLLISGCICAMSLNHRPRVHLHFIQLHGCQH